MKGYKQMNMAKILSELHELKSSAKRTTEPDFIHATLLEDGTWEVKAHFTIIKSKKYKSRTFNVDNIHTALVEYKECTNLKILLDDMIVQPDVYLPMDWIFVNGKEVVKKFIEIIETGDEVEFMNAYIGLFDQCFGVAEPDYKHHYPNSIFSNFNGEWRAENEEEYCEKQKRFYDRTVETTRSVLEQEPVLLDFFDHYKELSVENLIERYKDKRFFKMQ